MVVSLKDATGCCVELLNVQTRKLALKFNSETAAAPSAKHTRVDARMSCYMPLMESSLFVCGGVLVSIEVESVVS